MSDLFRQGCQSLLEAGPGMIMLLIVLYGFYRLMLHLGSKVGLKIISSLERPAEALTKQADALMVQSVSVDRLAGSIQEYVNRDANEHKEIIMLQKVIREELKGIRIKLEEIPHGRREDRKTPED